MDNAISSKIHFVLEEHSDQSVNVDSSLAPYIAIAVKERLNYDNPTEHDSTANHEEDDDLVELLMDHCCLNDRVKAVKCLEMIQDIVVVQPVRKQQQQQQQQQLGEDCTCITDGTVSTSSSLSDCSTPKDLLTWKQQKQQQQTAVIDGGAVTIFEEIVVPKNEVEAADIFLPTHLLDDDDEEAAEGEGDPSRSIVKDREVQVDEENILLQKQQRQDVNRLEAEANEKREKSIMEERELHERREQKFQMEQTAQLLLSIHSDLSYEAAGAASRVAKGDVNLAQHAIEQALAAPPVCRHMLHDGCYRSDCHFSHDIDSHTCSFWMRGRCGKGSGCKFLHGFSEMLLDGVNFFSEEQCILVESSAQPNSCLPQFSKSKQQPQESLRNRSGSLSLELGPSAWSPSVQSLQQTNVPSWSCDFPALAPSACNAGDPPAHLVSPPPPYSSTRLRGSGLNSWSATAQRTNTKKAVGFPVTAKGLMSGTTSNMYNNMNKEKQRSVVKIPVDVWSPNPHHYRSAAECFHIEDPLERYEEVTRRSHTRRSDVMDLHFQSSKTVPIVLSKVLPKKLQTFSEVWLVTGTGHHVPGQSHQKGGGVLETVVCSWLNQTEYKFFKGKDKNGYGGAILVKR